MHEEMELRLSHNLNNKLQSTIYNPTNKIIMLFCKNINLTKLTEDY